MASGVGGGEGCYGKPESHGQERESWCETSALPFAGFVNFGKSLHLLKVNTNSFVKD